VEISAAPESPAASPLNGARMIVFSLPACAMRSPASALRFRASAALSRAFACASRLAAASRS
jgi:hypothetical protein